MNKLLLYTLFFFSLFVDQSSFASIENSFSHLTIKDGLSQNGVFSIEQDQYGNMWFATSDGISRYDGYRIKIFRHQPNDSTSLVGNITTMIKKDSRDRLWITSRSGLSCYDDQTESFQNFYIRQNDKKLEVSSFVEISENLFLAGTPNGLFAFDPESEKMQDEAFPIIPHKMHIICMLRVKDEVFIGTMSGLFVYHIKQKTIQLYNQQFHRIRIQTLLRQEANKLWVGTEGKGLFYIDLGTNQIKNYSHDPLNPAGLSSNYIRSLGFDSQNKLWIGTFDKLNILTPSTGTFQHIQHEPFRDNSLSQNSIRSICRDQQGGMWIGTYFGGVNYYHTFKNRFRHICQLPITSNTLSNNNVSCMKEDSNGDLWIGTIDAGLNHWEQKTNQFIHYTNQSTHGRRLASNNIKSIYIDEENNLVYIGSHAGGLSILDRKTKQITNYSPDNSSITDSHIYAIQPNGKQELWLGAKNGLIRFDSRTQQFSKVNQVQLYRITNLFTDSKQRLWIGSEKGVQLYTQNEGQLIQENFIGADQLSTQVINCIYETVDSTICIATRNGLFKLNEKRQSIRQISTQDGLANEVIYGIQQDLLGRLWLSTNGGLSCLTPDNGKIRNFTDLDGIQSNQFNMYSYCTRSSGEMCFGGINGITCFWPNQMRDNPYMPAPVINELKLFNRTVKPGDATGILDRSIRHTKHITFKPEQSVFTLGFVVTNYISGQHNYFAYKLEGFDKEWYYLDQQGQISYSNLPQGDYTFLVKAANSDGHWNNVPTSLQIRVLPLWYETWWAILLFIGAATALVAFIIRYFWIQKSMKAELMMERIEKEKTDELNQMKLHFFINLSHELRTPLSLIMNPLQEISEYTSDRWIKNQLDYAMRNTSRLMRIVNQLMDYRRAELGVFDLKVKSLNAYELVKECFSSFEKLAHQKQIKYLFHSDIQDHLVLVDANYLEMIVNNLLSNAFKFTNDEGCITLSLGLQDHCLVLEVNDTGIGIPVEKQPRIFERFYQVNTEKTGSGIGLSLVKRLVDLHHATIEVKSSANEGTTFKISIPQDRLLYKASELMEENETHRDSSIELPEENDIYLLQEEEDSSTSIPVEVSAKKGKLLIVEDNDEVRRYLSDGLKPFFDIIEATQGQEAFDYLASHEVDVILSDIMMPVMDGVKLCTLIKNNIRTCHLPVILLSAKTDVRYQLEAFKMGADDYLTKPFSLSILKMKIQNQIRSRQRIFDHHSRSFDIEPEKISFNSIDLEFLSKAKEVVEANISNIDFSTDDFSREMSMCRSNLHLKLKSITGESAIEFIRKIRFKKACELLEEGRYTVGEISSMVGFSTQSYFSAIFKKYFGCQPTEYVKMKKR